MFETTWPVLMQKMGALQQDRGWDHTGILYSKSQFAHGLNAKQINPYTSLACSVILAVNKVCLLDTILSLVADEVSYRYL